MTQTGHDRSARGRLRRLWYGYEKYPGTRMLVLEDGRTQTFSPIMDCWVED